MDLIPRICVGIREMMGLILDQIAATLGNIIIVHIQIGNQTALTIITITVYHHKNINNLNLFLSSTYNNNTAE